MDSLSEHYFFSTLYAGEADDHTVAEMSELFSHHYGTWDTEHTGRSGRVCLSAQRIKREYITPDSCAVLARERKNGKLIGYAVATRKSFEGKHVSWITQFVVHTDHQNIGIGKGLLYALWGESHLDAWGIVTSNPYAIRALEKVTHRRCALQAIRQNQHWLLKIANDSISYINDTTELIIDDTQSVINTNFFVSHSDVMEKIRNVSRGLDWVLGTLDPGWEWFAFTFREQRQFPLSDREIAEFLETADQMTRHAYSKMAMREHPWTRHTAKEIDFILKRTGISAPAFALDLGCGTGRHSVELARRGIHVTAVDYNAMGVPESENITFIQEDVRKFHSPRKFDLVLCLYDVIGTYADSKSNAAIVKTIVSSMHERSYAVISVMNLNYLLSRKPDTIDIRDGYDKLLALLPQKSMQQTGDVFDQKRILVDTRTGVCYRREQFSGSNTDLPREYIIRDCRYTLKRLKSLLQKMGLEVVFYRYVRAGSWEVEREAQEGKEILVICRLLCSP